MNSHEDDELDAVMREWAARHAAADGKLDDLVERVQQQLRERAIETAQRVAPGRTVRTKLAWLAGAALAATVALIIYVVGSTDSTVPDVANDGQVPVHGRADVTSLSPIVRWDMAEKRLLAQELQQEFAGRFAWIMESGDETKLGLKPAENAAPKKMVAVRFVMESRAREGDEWKPLKVMDFLALAEETVQASPSSNHGSSVELWTYATPDGLIAVDVELNLTGALPVRVSSSRLLSAGAPAEIWHAERDGVQYRLYQAAELVDQERVG